MKRSPIKYNSEMVNAILQGLKTQTRRPLDVQPYPIIFHPGIWRWGEFYAQTSGAEILSDGTPDFFIKLALDNCKYGKAGDRLWVQEAFSYPDFPDGVIPQERESIFYRADYHDDPHGYDGELSGEAYRKWLPPSAMPRRISRITQEITGRRVERLQDISEADAKAEGVRELWLQEGMPGAWWSANPRDVSLHARDPISAFRKYWESIYGEGSWDANPLVFVIGTKVIE